MEYKHINQRKGVAGLNVLLSVIAMLFMIGLVVMVFVIAGARLQESVESTVDSEALGNSTQYTSVATSSIDIGYPNIANSTFEVYNVTGEDTLEAGVDYGLDLATSLITFTSDGAGKVNVSGSLLFNTSFTYTPRSEAGIVINDTYQSLDDVVDWFPTIVVLAAMIVLILLVVIIINSIKGSGITGQRGA